MMLRLQMVTSPRWTELALAHLDAILVEQAHLEKKAAAAALNLLFRYPDLEPLQAPLAGLAREELEHFTRVLALCRARGIAYGRQRPNAYAEQLLTIVRRDEPMRLLDSLLCCAVIEARSCERLKLLGEALAEREPGLAAFYRELWGSEARHHALYLDLAEQVVPAAQVRPRLTGILAHEAAVLARWHPAPRLHG